MTTTAAQLPSTFTGEVGDFLRSEVSEIGVYGVIGGLEAELLKASGDLQLIDFAMPQEEYDGALAAALASGDAIAAALGHPPRDPAVADAMAPIADDLRGLPGVADMAERALALFLDPGHENFGASPGVFESRAQLDAVAADVLARLAAAKADHPGTWDVDAAPAGDLALEAILGGEGDDMAEGR